MGFKELPQLPGLSSSVCTFCVCLWVRALQCKVRDYTHIPSRIFFVSVLPCKVFSSPRYMRMSEQCPMSPLKCLNPFAQCAQCSVLTSVKIKMFLSEAATLPYLFLCLPLPPSLPLSVALSSPGAVCFFPSYCTVFYRLFKARTPCRFPPETEERCSCVFPHLEPFFRKIPDTSETLSV